MYFFWYIFDNNTYINNILFKFLVYKLFASIDNNKIWKSKSYINLTQL